MLIALGCLLLGASFLMSGHYVPWTSFEPQWIAGLGAALVALAALLPEHAPIDRRYRVPPLAWGALALAVVPMVQWGFGFVPFRSDTLLAATYLAAFAAMIVVGRELAARPEVRFLSWLQGALLAGASLSAVIALLQWLGIDLPTIYVLPLGRGDRPFGNLAQPNQLASLLCLGLAATLYFYETRRLGPAAAAACALLLGWSLALTESRAGWVMFALLAIGWLLLRRRAALRLSRLAALTGVILFFGAVALLPALNDALLLSSTPDAGLRLHGGTRTLHWATLTDAALQQPWFGYGWGQVSQAQAIGVMNHPASGEWIQNSHNLVLDLVIHNGLPIGLLVTGLLAWWFMRRVRACGTGAQFALLAGVAMVFTHAMVEFPLDYVYFLMPVGMLMGALHALEAPQAPQHTIGRASFAAWVVALCAMLAWIGVEYMKVDSAARQLRFVLLGVGVDKVPDAPEPDVWLLDQPREYHRFLLTPARPGLSEQQLNFMLRNTTRAARPNAMLRMALALGLNDQPKEAADWLLRICKMHSTARCDEGRSSWAAAQTQWPVLQGIDYPATPLELLRR
jgi:O-antigen ligase